MPRHFLSAGAAAMPVDSNGVPSDMSHVYATGNLTADMYANVTAEPGGRVLATRLYELTDDPGTKDMLSFLIARDTMHQQQWLAVLEELGGSTALPIPKSFPQEQEKAEFSCSFPYPAVDGQMPAEGRWTQGSSIDGHGEFKLDPAKPLGEEPVLSAPARRPPGVAGRPSVKSVSGFWPTASGTDLGRSGRAPTTSTRRIRGGNG